MMSSAGHLQQTRTLNSYVEMSDSLCSRIGQTLLLVYVATLEGWCTGIFGPTLPELLCVYDTDLKTLSTLFFVFGLMNALGSIFGCFLLTKLKNYLLISIAATVASVTLCAVPYVADVHAAIVLTGIIALCVGILFNTRIFSADYLWPGKPFAIHLVIGGFAVGPIIAAGLAEPFLPSSDPVENQTRTDHNLRCAGHQTRVQDAFVLLACLGFPLVVASLCLYVYYRNEPSSYVVILPFNRSTRDSRRGYVLFITFFFLLCMPSGGIFVTFGNLLTTFGVGSVLHIDVNVMALLTALFWATFVSGRLVMTVVSGFIRQIWIIGFCFIGLFSASTILLIVGERSIEYLALGTGLFGIFCAPFSAACFSWTREHIELTGFVIALGSVGEYTGAMVGPYIGGVLIGSFGARAFFYVIIGIVLYQLLLFVCIYIIGTCVLEHGDTEDTYLLTQGLENESETSSYLGNGPTEKSESDFPRMSHDS